MLTKYFPYGKLGIQGHERKYLGNIKCEYIIYLKYVLTYKNMYVNILETKEERKKYCDYNLRRICYCNYPKRINTTSITNIQKERG